MAWLETQRLTLRPPVLADAPALHEMFADPEVMAYGSRPAHTDMAQTMAVLERTIAANADGTADFFTVFEGGTVIGNAGVWRENEIGFSFLRRVWGAGLAREAVAALIERARAGGRTRLTADVDPRNVRSLVFLRRFGFAVTGQAKNTWQVGDMWTDSVYLALDL